MKNSVLRFWASNSVLALAARHFWRDARAGQLQGLALIVVLAVTAWSAVGFVSDRLQQGLKREATQLLGGDAVVVSDAPTPAAVVQAARERGLRGVATLSFPTMARASAEQGGAARLVALKAVAAGYPLRGVLSLYATPVNVASVNGQALGPTTSPTSSTKAAPGVPAPGRVWVDASLLAALSLRPGDSLLLGESRLQIEGVIAQEPDRGAEFLNFAPRVLMHEADLAATGLVQWGSRVTWRYLVATAASTTPTVPTARAADAAAQGLGSAAALKDFENWVQTQISSQGWRGLRLESLATGRPEMRQTFDRAQRFLKLVALLSALLSAVAVALAARNFAHAHWSDAAMLRVLGLSQRRMAGAYALELLLLAVVASALGLLLGYALHGVLWRFLAPVLVGSGDWPAPGAMPLVGGLGMGLCLLLAFGLPPILQLARVPPLRVLRRDVGEFKLGAMGVLAGGTAGFALLLLALSDDWMLGLVLVGGFAASALLFALCALLFLRGLRRSALRSVGPLRYRGAQAQKAREAREAKEGRWPMSLSWRLAVRQLTAHPALVGLQVSALALGLWTLLLLLLLRTDLIGAWQQISPRDAPNRFVINIQPEQAADFQNALRRAGVTRYDWFPMLRARLVAVNGRSVRAADYSDERAQRLVEREFNLSYSREMPEHNRLLEGTWASAGDSVAAAAVLPQEISVEEGLAKTLGLHLGDALRFDLAGLELTATISSLRRVDWGSMRVNFFVMFPLPPNAPEPAQLPQTFITAFTAPAVSTVSAVPDVPALDQSLVQAFPNVTVVDLSSSLNQVQQLLSSVIRALELLLALSLALGWVVLWLALSATRQTRVREYALMRALGASARLLRRMQGIELLSLGLLAGLLASVAAGGVAALLARWVLDLDWWPTPWLLLGGGFFGAVLATLAGWWSLRGVLRQNVMQTLRQAAPY